MTREEIINRSIHLETAMREPESFKDQNFLNELFIFMHTVRAYFSSHPTEHQEDKRGSDSDLRKVIY